MLVIVQWTILGKSQYKWRGSIHVEEQYNVYNPS